MKLSDQGIERALCGRGAREKMARKDGTAIEIRPNAEYRLLTGRTPKSDGFFVVVSSANL